MFRSLVLVLLSVLSFTLKDCSNRPQPKVTGPDLVPISKNPDNTLGCAEVGLNPNQQVVITVTNQGDADAPASLTRITFSNVGSTDLNTPAIPAKGSMNLQPVPIPNGCGGANCSATITVNVNGAVPETPSAQQNNSIVCVARVG